MAWPEILRKHPVVGPVTAADLVKFHALVEQPPSAAHFVVFRKAGTVYVKDGETGCIEYRGDDAGALISEALEAFGPSETRPCSVVALGVLPVKTTVQLKPFTAVWLHGTLRAEADVLKVVEMRRADCSSLIGGVIDCNGRAHVGVDVHASWYCTVKTWVRGIMNGTFEEDDGSGLGTQTYPDCGVRIKGIKDVASASENVVDVVCRWTGGKGNANVGVYLTSTTSDSSQRANGNVVIARYICGYKKGIFVENGGYNTIFPLNVSNNEIGIHLGPNSNNTTIYGSGFMETNDYAIYAEKHFTIVGDLQFSGSTYGIYNLDKVNILGHINDGWIYDKKKAFRPSWPGMIWPAMIYFKYGDPEVGTNDAYGSALEFTATGAAIVPLLFRIRVSSVASGETITVKIETVWEDGETRSREIAFTSDGVRYVAGDDDYYFLTNRSGGHFITAVRFYAKSDQASTSADILCSVTGVQC